MDKRIEIAQTFICLKLPFYAFLLLRLEVEEAKEGSGVYMLDTDGRTIRYNPDGLDGFTQAEINAVLLHVVVHSAFGHTWRASQYPDTDQKIMGMAMDYVANEIVQEACTKVVRDPKSLALPAGSLLSEEFNDMSIEAVYNILRERVPPQSQESDSHTPPPSYGDGEDSEEDISSGSGEQGEGDAHTGKDFEGDFGSITPSHEALDDKEKDTHSFGSWMQALESSAQSVADQAGNNSAGSTPGRLSDVLEEYCNPDLPWEVIAGDFARDNCAPDYHPLTADRRYAQEDVFIMGIDDDMVDCVVMVWDTSASMPMEALEKAHAEAVSLVTAGVTERVLLLQVDTEVSDVQEITRDSPFPEAKIHGRGGTYFDPPFKWVEDNNLNPACLIYVTDGYGSVTVDPPDYPVLWVTTAAACTDFPFGTTLELNEFT